MVAMQADAKGISLNVGPLNSAQQVRADGGQLTRVLVNLLHNAVRHTPAGGAVTITTGQAGEESIIEVSDTGPGIPADYVDRVFDRFVQVPGETQGGAGLGLSIARSIVRAHGGDIAVESAEGEGSTFTVRLPGSIVPSRLMPSAEAAAN